MAILPWRKRPAAASEGSAAPKTVIAAAIPLEGPDKIRVGRNFKATSEDWQKEAWYYFDAVGEFRSAVTWIANAVSKADLHAAVLDPETGLVGDVADDPRVMAVAQAVLGGPLKRSQHLQTLAVQWQVPGESYIIIRPTRAGQPDEWLVISGRRVTYKGSSWSYDDPQTLRTVTLTQRDRLIRVWSPHPDDSARADSAARPALPILREIEMSSQNIAARLASRLAGNGVWMFPSEADFPRQEGLSKAESVLDYFMSAAEANLRNPGQASAQVPIVFEVPGDQISNAAAGFLDFSTAFDAAVVELRTNALSRLAATLDMPNEVAEGSSGGMNHWGAWQVEESTYKVYIEPLLDRIGDALADHYLRPALTAMGIANPERYTLAWDTTSIVARPDRSNDLTLLYDKLLISDEYYRDQMGVPEDAVPEEEERQRRLLEQLVLTAPALLSEGFGEALGIEASAPAPQSAPAALPAAPETSERPDSVPEGLVAAAELIVYDALSRAGSRMLTREHRGQFGHVRKELLYLTVPGERDTEKLLEGSFQFVDNVADAFRVSATGLHQCLSGFTAEMLNGRVAYDRDQLRSALNYSLVIW